MDIFINRKEMLRKLIDDQYSGSQAAFSRKAGIKSSQLNRWLSGTTKSPRNITEQSARDIEKAAGVDSGYLDGLANFQANISDAPDVRDYVPLTVSGLLEDLRGKISEQPEPVRAAIANLVTGYVMSPTPEEGKAVADMIERMLSNK